MAPAAPLSELLAECQDTVDHVTLEDFTAFTPSELVLLEMPAPWRAGQRYRCFARASLLDYAATSANHLGVEEESGTAQLVIATYLPGVDLDQRDLEFVARSLEQPVADGPTVFHVARVVEVPPSRVHGSHGAAAHVHELLEARWERELWSLFDRAVMPSVTTCPSGHPLRHRPRSGDRAFGSARAIVICDTCESILVDMGRYRCTRNCDFDICQECYSHGTSGSAPDVPDRVVALAQQLDDFWRDHEDFVLPGSPPRQNVRSKLLSPAVTKWNGFTIETQNVLGLRRCFLASLEQHGVDVSGLRPHFWPGCSAQRERAERYVRRALRGQQESPAEALVPHARHLVPLLGPSWGEDLALELLSTVLSQRLALGAEAAAAAAPEAAAHRWSSLWPAAAIMANRLVGPVVQAFLRAPWHFSAVVVGILLCAVLSPP